MILGSSKGPNPSPFRYGFQLHLATGFSSTSLRVPAPPVLQPRAGGAVVVSPALQRWVSGSYTTAVP
jgi:hypothetical protein